MIRAYGNNLDELDEAANRITAEDLPWTLDTAIEGAADRLSPILMTSLATALGLLPLALGSGELGRELEGPWRS